MTPRRTAAVQLGNLQARLANSGLRNLKHDGREMFRAMALVIRDREWRTPEPVARSVRVNRHANGGLAITGRTPVGRSTVEWRFVAHGTQGRLHISATCTARGTVITNRCGLVMLMPVAHYAGARCRVVHSNGRVQTTQLPIRIAAHQPLRDVCALAIEARDGTRWRLALSGDTFELEDQRNWLDPTFKLYSRPLALPVPYRLRDGETIAQSIDWHLEAVACAEAPPPASASIRRGAVPALGLATAPGRIPRNVLVVDALRDAAPNFLLHRVGTRRDVEAAAGLCAAVNAELRLECIHADMDGAAALLRALSPGARGALTSIAPFGLTDDKKTRASRALPGLRVAGGTWSDFVQLKRRGAPAGVDRIAFALCPTVHARDDRTLIESLDSMRDVFQDARRIAGTRAIDAGPSSLRRRLVPRSGRPADRPRGPGGIPYDVDPRQRQMIAAAWLAGTIAHAATTGIASLCAFEAAGARGVLSVSVTARGATRIARTPAYAVFAALAEARGAALDLLGIDASWGAAFIVKTTRPELWLVELAGRTRTLTLRVPCSILRLEVRQGHARWLPVLRDAPATEPATISTPAYGILRCTLHASAGHATAAAALAHQWLGRGQRP